MKRVYDKELLDLGHYTKEEYEHCLKQLGQVGRFLGGDRASLKTFETLTTFKSILDVGCGGGQFAGRLAKQFPEAKVTGIDISHEAIAFAKKYGVNGVNFEVALQQPENSVDVVTSTLVCHHLNDEELVLFLKQSLRTARKYVVINDLHRHPLAYLAYAFVGALFCNRLIYFDGLLSIRRSFTKPDWVRFLTLAGIDLSRCKISWHFPFRWVVCITK